ncbi:MFS transporter [Metabacillus niabensis]|uniref:MFS transporter n=1 Tax=Metabacillus niabensis TaxID=324854 RepID=UPI001CFA2E6B|nr:MFS transporter [Metabacillus niabensis]
MSTVNATMDGKRYHSSKVWKIGLFALNNTATNFYLFVLGFVAYYATGIAGLTVVVVSTVLTAMRFFDGITDPIIGYFIDKTESKFGKYRPLMIVGNVILAVTILIMYNVTHLLPESLQLIFFIMIYSIHIIGYTFQTACTKAAQTVLTNDPKQRPLFSVFDASYNIALFTGMQIVVASYLVPKYGGFTIELFTELNIYGIIAGAIFTLLAVAGIWEKDRKEFFGLAEKNVETKFRDYWPILKGNRPLQMLVIAASTDKLASSVVRHAAVGVMFFGILIGDYALSGTISLITIIPTLLISYVGLGYARKIGLKRAFVSGTWFAMISFVLLLIFFFIADATKISLTNIGLTTIVFLVLYSIGLGFGSLTGNMVIPMIADCSDYETYKTGRYILGMLGTIFSFVDKVISSLATTIVGLLLALIGFKDALPQVDDTLTTSILVMTLILKFVVPILGWLASIIAMKFYVLDDAKMVEIQEFIAQAKENSQIKNVQTPPVIGDLNISKEM